MKYKTTDREQRENNALVIGFGYCSIQNITRYLNANAYTRGTLGWRADFYEFGGFTISTGYAPLTYVCDSDASRIGGIVHRKMLEFNKRIGAGKFKTLQNTGDWHKCEKFVREKIEKIYADAVRVVYER